MPLTIKKKFALNSETANNRKIFKDVLRRFTEKTQTFEIMVHFNSTVEKTDESSITQIKNFVSGEIIDQKERRRYIRKEMQEYNHENLFHHSQTALDKELFSKLIDMFTKANQLINIMYQDQIEKSKRDSKILSKMTV